ncbi:peptidase [Gordonia phage Suzy]|uniref:Peptidase n=1 Tax=Gordonia phage Suzy TaxID=2201430 RepID=A0A2Z4Q800_9CAUD|nr:tail protein [Gordonia phage Suzy]AWY06114.1 peptidase [Gordonia phage Suzy]
MTATVSVQRSFPDPLNKSACEELLSKWGLGDERCGVILHDGTVIELRNGWEDPSHAFGILREELEEIFSEHGTHCLMGIWHTHPNNRTSPSKHDAEGWPTGSLRYFIVTQSEVAEWANPFDRLY